MPIANELRTALDEVNPKEPNLSGYKPIPLSDLGKIQTCSNINLAFDEKTGGIVHLQLRGDPKNWAGNSSQLGLLSYTFTMAATRMAESIWFSFIPPTTNPEGWRFDKMGFASVNPTQVAINGSRYMHAVNSAITYQEGNHKLEIETLDAPLVTPGTPFFLRFDDKPVDTSTGMHFNLFNNAWNTNYIIWYEDDERFRFNLKWN